MKFYMNVTVPSITVQQINTDKFIGETSISLYEYNVFVTEELYQPSKQILKNLII